MGVKGAGGEGAQGGLRGGLGCWFLERGAGFCFGTFVLA